jgi:hypothetical protein
MRRLFRPVLQSGVTRLGSLGRHQPKESASMKAPVMSQVCKSYVKSTLSGDMRSAYQDLSQLVDKELFRGLAVLARIDMNELFEKGVSPPPAFSDEIPGVGAVLGSRSSSVALAAMGGQVLRRTPQLNYGFHVVNAAKLKFAAASEPPTPQAGEWAKEYVHHCVALHELPLEIDEDLTGSLPTGGASLAPLTDADFRTAATTLGCDLAAMKAVAQVESGGSGFGADGRPIIRYELHRFQSKTNAELHKTHPHVSQPTLATGGAYHNGQQSREYTMLYNAMLLERKGKRTIEEAIESVSWGKFQIMGENWSMLQASSALAFARDMWRSEVHQLSAFVGFVQGKGLVTALRTHNWAQFARGYNGANFAVNEYDVKLARAFERFNR